MLKIIFALIIVNLTGCSYLSHTPPAEPFSITFAGDTLLGDAALPSLEQHGYGWAFEYVNLLTSSSDYSILNAEAPITTIETPFDSEQRWCYNVSPKSVTAIARMGFDAVGLSNNHAMDRGGQGVNDTWTYLQENGLEPFGAGVNKIQAEKPLIVETPYGKVGVVALSNNWGNERIASDNLPGTIPLSKESIVHGYELARKAGAKWVVAFVHWGTNYSEVNDNQRYWADLFAETGYVLVIGHGAHNLQSIEIVRGIPVVYSIGNIVFGTPGRFNSQFPGFGVLVTAELGRAGFEQLIFICLQTDNERVSFQPRPCTEAQTRSALMPLNESLVINSTRARLYLNAHSH